MEDHKQKDCPNTLIPCPRGCNNGSIKIARKNKDNHLVLKCPNRPYSCEKCKNEMEFKDKRSHKMSCLKRQYTCSYCNETGVYEELTTTHLRVSCPKVKIKCSKCSIEMLRCDQSGHIQVCQYEPVRCKYYSIGCEEKPLRKDLSKHEENAQLHLKLATDKILTLTKMLFLKNTLIFKVTGFVQKKIQGNYFYSPDFFTVKSGYKMCLRVDANGMLEGAGTHVSVFACLMKGDHDDTLTWPFTGRVIVELLNQLEDKNHPKRTITFLADNDTSERVVDDERGIGWGFQKFISHAALNYNASTNTQYLKDDTLVFRVSAEAPDHKPWLECTN